MNSKSWVRTKAPEEMPRGQVNKLKGMAMEAGIQELMDRVEGSEDSLSSVLQEAEDILKDVYNVKKMFRLNDGRDERTYRRQVSEVDSNLKLALDKSELASDTVTIKVPQESSKVFLGYKKCSNCGYMFPPHFCANCGGAVFDKRFFILSKISEFNERQRKQDNRDLDRLEGVSSLSQKHLESVGGGDKVDSFLEKVDEIKASKWNVESKWGSNEWCNCQNPDKKTHYFQEDSYRKCRKCRKGNYSKMRTEFSSKDWNPIKTNISLKEGVTYLQEEGFIAESSFKDKISGKRLDTWRFDGERVEIFESKNKEKTGLTYGNIAQVFYYVKALRKAGLDTTEDARIIYNGEFPSRLLDSIMFFQNEYGYSIEAFSLKQWCREKGTYIESITIGKDIEGLKYSDSGDYKVNVKLTNSEKENPEIIIKDRDYGEVQAV